MRSMAGRAVAYGALALSLAGCASARSALGGAARGATQSAANAAGEAAGRAIVAHFVGPTVPGAPGGLAGPQMMTYYANWMFTLAFNSGGYWVPGADLRQGQSVTFEFESSGQKQRLERAFLTKLANGDEWWRVKWYSLADKPDTVIFEAMFNPDRSQLLRMRGKTSGQQAGEIPVEQNTGFSWREPTYLTTESLNAATVGTETVATPAGNFTAKHIRYTLMGGGSYEWWTADNAPGGVVKYVVSYGSDSYTETLVAVGSNATTELGSY